MLHIVLVILKILGMILLGILGILLGIFLAVLLVPVRYGIEGSYYGTGRCHIRVTWLLHLISLRFQYGEEKNFRIKILGIDLNRIVHRKKRAGAKDGLQMEERAKVRQKVEETLSEDTKDSKETGAAQKSSQETSGVSIQKKSKRFWYKIKEFLQNIKRAAAKIPDRVKELWKKKKEVTDFFKSERNRIVFGVFKKEISYLFRHIRPRKLRMRLHYGMEDPSHTGMILAALCTLYPFYARFFQIQPDFERKVLEGEIKTKGHIRGVHLILSILRIVMKKECRELYRQITNK